MQLDSSSSKQGIFEQPDFGAQPSPTLAEASN